MQTAYHLPPFPTGWFTACFSHELKVGEIQNKTFCGREVVLFRTQSGQACMTDAYCPHMGGHFGHGGTIEGETIKCPFHGFCFDTKGDCTSTGYGTRPSPKAKVYSWPIREVNGIILAWFHPDEEAPDWTIPELEWKGWSKLRTHTWELKGHPQETSENSVDIGHFDHIHGYKNIKVVKPLATDGPLLTSTYYFERPGDDVFGMSKNPHTQIDVNVHGLGYSFVNVNVLNMGIHTRQFVLPTPIDGENIELRIAISTETLEKPSKVNPVMALVPPKVARRFINRMIHKAYIHDVEQDFKVWKNKIYLHPPALSQGDGPIAQYRVWARQFYDVNDMTKLDRKARSKVVKAVVQ